MREKHVLVSSFPRPHIWEPLELVCPDNVYKINFYLAFSLALAMVSSYLHISVVNCIDLIAFKGVFGLGTIGDGVESYLNFLLLIFLTFHVVF